MTKKKIAKAATIAAPDVRVAGYAIIALENRPRDRLRVTEGEVRATLPNIMANNVGIITTIGTHTVVTVFDTPDFRGHSLTLRCSNYELVERPRNDIGSIPVSFVKTPVSECQVSQASLSGIKAGTGECVVFGT